MIVPSERATFKQFVDSLRIDFNSRENIPAISENDDWRKIGNIIASSPTFIKNSVPTTENFPNWIEWGRILYGTMNR